MREQENYCNKRIKVNDTLQHTNYFLRFKEKHNTCHCGNLKPLAWFLLYCYVNWRAEQPFPAQHCQGDLPDPIKLGLESTGQAFSLNNSLLGCSLNCSSTNFLQKCPRQSVSSKTLFFTCCESLCHISFC